MKKTKLIPIIASMAFSYTAFATQVNVNHLAPFADTLAGTAVSINVNGNQVLSGVQFLQSSGYLELAETGVAPGETTLDVFAPPGVDMPAISATVDLAADTFYSVTAIGDGVNQDLALLALEDPQGAPSDGNIWVRVIHAAPFAQDINATAASIRLDDGTVVNGLDNVLFGQNSDFFELPAGTYDLNISSADGSIRLIDIAPLDLASGTVVNVFAVGDGNNQPFGAYAVFGNGQSASLALEQTQPTRVKVAHLAPFAANTTDTAVSIEVNDTEVLTGVTYAQASDYLVLADDGSAPGSTDLAVFAPPGAADPAITANVDLDAETDYTVVAIGNIVNQPLELLPLVDDNSPTADGFARVRVVHSAPFAENLNDTAVSIRTDDGDLVAGLTGVVFGQASGFLDLPAGLYDLNVATPDGSTVLIDMAPVYLKDGDNVTIFAIGDGVNQDLGFYALFADGTNTVIPNEKELSVLNAGLNGSWSNPNNHGQGFLIEVLPEINTLFVAWFTYDNIPAEAGETAIVGEPNHRWLTAQGTYNGTEASLPLLLTQGGLFVQEDPTTTTEVGTLNIKFNNCHDAEVSFNLTDSELSGTIPLSRISGSAVPLCQSLIP